MNSTQNNISMNSSSIDHLASFNPYGLKALLVDHDPTSLFDLSSILQSCQYQVTTCSWPTEALLYIRNSEIKFDIVITEVNFAPDMINGIEFLQTIVRETDLPVVIVSADERVEVIIECVTKGACAYLPKPVRMEVTQVLWQHVARKQMFRFGLMKQVVDNVEKNEPDSSNSGEDKELCGSSDCNDGDDERDKVRGKKHRWIWSDELHQKFVLAIKELGIHKAVPKRVLELMNVPGLRRENVASHLQKYRLNLQKISASMQENFAMQNYNHGVPIGGSSSMTGHNGLFIATPPNTEMQPSILMDHHIMDQDSLPLMFPFREPDFS